MSSLPVNSIDERAFYNELVRYIGENNYATANPRIVKVIDANRFIVKVSLAGYRQLILALALMKKIGNDSTAFYTIWSSGTLKALSKHIGISNPKE